MKRLILTSMFILVSGSLLFSQSYFSGYIGTDLFNYKKNFLTTGVEYIREQQDAMEMTLGGSFNIFTEVDSNVTLPSFFIPVNFGLNFIFPGDVFSFPVGVGLQPSFHINTVISDQNAVPPVTDTRFQFYLGPYLRVGTRIKVHSIMTLNIEIQQNLFFGGDSWINTSTAIRGGILFPLNQENVQPK